MAYVTVDNSFINKVDYVLSDFQNITKFVRIVSETINCLLIGTLRNLHNLCVLP